MSHDAASAGNATGSSDRVAMLRELAERELSPQLLEVHDDSHGHAGRAGTQSHLRVIVVSQRFEGMNLVARHRVVNQVAAPVFALGLHALAIRAMTPAEWVAKNGETLPPPPCSHAR